MLERIIELLTRQLVRLRGQSMAPALRRGNWVRVSRLAYRKRPPSRFDVVRFKDPSRPGAWSIKRIVGLPMEFVELRDGNLIIDGRRVHESHAALKIPGSHAWAPREDEFVVLGDNRSASTDSRKYGPVHRTSITGAVIGHSRLR